MSPRLRRFRGPGLSVVYVRPSGWRARCRCGVELCNHHSRAEALSAFLEHCENAHLDAIEEDDQ